MMSDVDKIEGDNSSGTPPPSQWKLTLRPQKVFSGW